VPLELPTLRYPLGSLRVIPVEAQASLLLLAGMLALRQPGFFTVATVFVLLLLSVFLHEAAHAAVGLWRGYEPNRLSLHAFGGLSVLKSPPTSLRDDLLIGLAGPLTSLAFGALLLLPRTFLPIASDGMTGALRTAGFLNLYWGAFNLLPAFPMDGGRLLYRVLARRSPPLKAVLTALRVSEIVIFLLGLSSLLALHIGGILFAGYLYLLRLTVTPGLLQEAREVADSALVSPPPYAPRHRPQRVDVTKL